MTEILTESFCERCGTRYTFESAAPRKSRLGRVRVVSKGLRNFVMQDESTLSEAMADARSDEERAATAHQLDAFHKTFNFCMTCRQYTCGNCWNTVEGRCLTCSPVPGMELAAAAETAEVAVLATAPEPPEAGLEPEAWPEADLSPDRLARTMALAGAAAVTDPADDQAAGHAEPEVPAAPAAPEVPATPQVRGLAPGQSLEEALAEYEAQVSTQDETAPANLEVAAEAEELAVAAGVVPEPEPVAEPQPEPVEVEPDLVAAAALAAGVAHAAEPEPESVAAEPEAEPVAEPVAEEEPAAPVVASPRDDVVEQPTWPAAPEGPTSPAATPPRPEQQPVANPWLTVAPDDGAGAPQWPTTPQWTRPAPSRDMPTTLAGRPLLPRDNAADLWAASAREVLAGGPSPVVPAAAAPVTPQPCVNCGLSLSANARFCRRCGTRQG